MSLSTFISIFNSFTDRIARHWDLCPKQFALSYYATRAAEFMVSKSPRFGRWVLVRHPCDGRIQILDALLLDWRW